MQYEKCTIYPFDPIFAGKQWRFHRKILVVGRNL